MGVLKGDTRSFDYSSGSICRFRTPLIGSGKLRRYRV